MNLLSAGKNNRVVIIAVAAVLVIAAVVAAVVVIPGINRSNQYKQGVTYAEHGMYDEAIQCFSGLGGYQDSDSYFDYCLLKKAAAQNDWKAVGEYAAKVPDFKDAGAYLRLSAAWARFEANDLEAALTGLEGLDALSETAGFRAAWQRQYADQKNREVAAAMSRGDWDQAVETIDHALLFCQDERLDAARAQCVSRIRARDYQQALALIEQEQYDEALALLRPMADDEKSAELIAHLDAGEPGRQYLRASMSHETDPHVLARLYTAAGDYRDAAERAAAYQAEADQRDYETALILIDERSWVEAKAILASLGGYEDSAVLMLACDNGLKEDEYIAAVQQISAGDYAGAAERLQALGEFRDSRMLLQTCEQALKNQRYEDAVAAYQAGNTEDAYALFQSLGDYKDSRIYCAWIENEGGKQE